MNLAIRRIGIAVALLFAVLIAYTSRWSIFDANSLNHNALNHRTLLRDQRNPRGAILAADGQTIAHSIPVGRGGDRIYVRRYSRPTLFGHPVGYSFVDRGNSGLENYYDGQLSGNRQEFLNLLDQILDRRPEGRDMLTDLDPTAQRIAEQDLGGQAGAAVVIEPSTGRVPVYVSNPGYNQNAVRSDAGYAALVRDRRGRPLFDRAGGASYPPGSTFKLVTATAALDAGGYTMNSRVNGDSPKTISGTPLKNDFNQSFGDIPLTTALVYSVNTVWAQLGVRLGAETLFKYMRRYGFGTPPPIDLPTDELSASGLRGPRGLLGPHDAIDVGRLSIGQERLAVTPLQMAEVVATIANGGVRMEPRIAQLFRDQDGRVVKRVKPQTATRVMSRHTAAQLTQMMTKVVDEGTGRAAQIGGLPVAGKTGTAERGDGFNTAWFVGFAPVNHPRYAIAVAVEKTTEQGGTIAAPIVHNILQSLLGR